MFTTGRLAMVVHRCNSFFFSVYSHFELFPNALDEHLLEKFDISGIGLVDRVCEVTQHGCDSDEDVDDDVHDHLLADAFV